MGKHPWKARMIATGVMIALSFTGLVITNVYKDGGWNYWRVMVPIFAIICLALSGYLRRASEVLSLTSIWHEVVHWISLGGATYLVSVLVGFGLIGRFEAALMMLILLSLTTFLLGIYVEWTFLVIGAVIGGFAIAAAWMEEYLFTVILPITLVLVTISFIVVFYSKKNKESDLQK